MFKSYLEMCWNIKVNFADPRLKTPALRSQNSVLLVVSRVGARAFSYQAPLQSLFSFSFLFSIVIISKKFISHQYMLLTWLLPWSPFALLSADPGCDLWIWAIQIKFDWLIDWFSLDEALQHLMSSASDEAAATWWRSAASGWSTWGRPAPASSAQHSLLINLWTEWNIIYIFLNTLNTLNTTRDRTGSAQLCPSGSSIPNKMTGNIKVWHYCRGSVTYERSLYPYFMYLNFGLNSALPRQWMYSMEFFHINSIAYTV